VDSKAHKRPARSEGSANVQKLGHRCAGHLRLRDIRQQQVRERSLSLCVGGLPRQPSCRHVQM